MLAAARTHSPTRRLTSASATRVRITSSDRKFSVTNSCRLRASVFLRSGMIAVCGIGRPSGCLNSAVTANQSAIAPTIAASAVACTYAQAPSRSRVRQVDHGSQDRAGRGRRRASGAARAGGRDRHRTTLRRTQARTRSERYPRSAIDAARQLPRAIAGTRKRGREDLAELVLLERFRAAAVVPPGDVTRSAAGSG